MKDNDALQGWLSRHPFIGSFYRFDPEKNILFHVNSIFKDYNEKGWATLPFENAGLKQVICNSYSEINTAVINHGKCTSLLQIFTTLIIEADEDGNITDPNLTFNLPLKTQLGLL